MAKPERVCAARRDSSPTPWLAQEPETSSGYLTLPATTEALALGVHPFLLPVFGSTLDLYTLPAFRLKVLG